MFCHGPPRLPLSSPRPALAKAGDPIRGRSRQGRRVGVEVPARCWAASGTTIGAYCFIGPPCPFRSSRRRPACGGSLFRVYRVRARARPSAPARFARLIARASQRAHFTCASNRGRSAPGRHGREAVRGRCFLRTHSSTDYPRSSLIREIFPSFGTNRAIGLWKTMRTGLPPRPFLASEGGGIRGRPAPRFVALDRLRGPAR